MATQVFETLNIDILEENTQEMFKAKFLEVFSQDTSIDFLLVINMDCYWDVWVCDYLIAMENLQDTKYIEESIETSVNFLYELYCEKNNDVY